MGGDRIRETETEGEGDRNREIETNTDREEPRSGWLMGMIKREKCRK